MSFSFSAQAGTDVAGFPFAVFTNSDMDMGGTEQNRQYNRNPTEAHLYSSEAFLNFKMGSGETLWGGESRARNPTHKRKAEQPLQTVQLS